VIAPEFLSHNKPKIKMRWPCPIRSVELKRAVPIASPLGIGAVGLRLGQVRQPFLEYLDMGWDARQRRLLRDQVRAIRRNGLRAPILVLP
jgi:hypothetical protein